MYLFKKQTWLTAGLLLTLTACGGGGDTVVTTTATTSVDVFDGAAIGCSVSSDGTVATEVGNGAYTFATVLDAGTVVTATGCTDSDTQSLLPALSGIVQSGAVVVSPITTLIVEAAIANGVAAKGVGLRTGAKSVSTTALQAAIDQIVTNLGLGDYKPTDPATANYVAAAKADTTGTTPAAVVMRVSLAISTLLKSVEVSAGPANASTAVAAVSQAIVNSLTVVDLTQTTGVEAVMTEAKTLAPAVASAIQTASDAIVTLVTLIINTTGDITLAIEVTTIIADFLNTADEIAITDTTIITELVTTHTGGGSFTIGGSVSDLTGSVTLQVNNGDGYTINANGAFTFSQSLLHGTAYAITVSTQPLGETCSISNGTGIVATADVTNIAVSCTTNPPPTSYSIIGGTISGSTGTLALQINAGDTYTATSNGSFNFVNSLIESSTYSVTVFTQPAGQTCSISNGSGTVGTVDVDNVAIVCIHNVNYVDFATFGSPGGTYWYVGKGQWERETWYDCQSFTETGLGESSISLSNTAGTDNLEINIQAKTITSESNQIFEEVFSYGKKTRPAESYVICPSTSNDDTPVITSPTEVEVNSGRTFITSLNASDADLPPEVLSFSLTDTPGTDNDLFKVTNFSEKANAACRAGNANQGHPDDSNNDNYFTVEAYVNSLEACQTACIQYPLNGGSLDSRCKGIEFRAQGADTTYPEPRCELWKVSIAATVPQPGYSCYARQSENPEVLSFINTPDFKVVLDADSDNIYEVEARVSDGVEGNSSTQTIKVTVVPNGEYIGKSRTACRAGTQNEGHPEDDVNNPNYFTVTNDVDSLEGCQALCDGYPLIDNPSVNCMGIEYRAEGADYADTASRCELWKAPIVATTPQKEYACYVRDHTRDSYGPDNSSYVGDYKAVDSVDGDFVVRTMSLSQQSASELVWTDAGISWTLTRTADRHKLSVGPDYPFTDGYVEAEVFWEADEVGGIVGPSGLVYRTDWAYAKLSHSQAIYQAYIDNNPGELTLVNEAERLIRELKWGIAEKINTAQAYRDYKNDLGAYGRTDEADRRITNFIAYVTAEVLKIEVDDSVSAWSEDNDLELFYNLEFTKDDHRPRPDESGWSDADLFLESIWQNNPSGGKWDASKITNINDGADRAFKPAGDVGKTLVANETQSLRYGGLMFEYDGPPQWPNIPDCEDWDQSGSCMEPGYKLSRFFGVNSVATGNSNIPYIYGIFDDRWNGHRTWAGNTATATESLAHTYFNIALADLEYDKPRIEAKTINFASDEQIQLFYGITKRNQGQYDEYLASNSLSCDDPSLKSEKRVPRSAVHIEGPGFLIRNETDHTYSVSLNQVGPMYSEELPPGEIFNRDTAWGHFTIDAELNLTGEQKYDNWDVVVPIAQFTAETLLTLYTFGGSASIPSIGGAINQTVTKVGSKIGSVAGAAMAKTAFGRAMLVSGRKALAKAALLGAHRNVLIRLSARSASLLKDHAIDTGLNLAFTKDLVDLIYTEDATKEYRTWRHSGFYGSTIEMYHIVGGPRLPCLNSEGDIEVRSSELQIMSHYECEVDNELALINGVSPICTLN
jgi:hypothetical protein